MAHDPKGTPKGSSGRRSAAAIRRAATVRSVDRTETLADATPVVGGRHRSHRAEQLLVLTVAIVFAVLGFPLHFLWIVAIVFMALLWGYMASDLGSSRGGGAVSTGVSAVAGEARDLGKDVVTHLSEHDGADSERNAATRVASVHETRATTVEAAGSAVADADSVTKKELYEEARAAGIEGRSAMTKEELLRALEE